MLPEVHLTKQLPLFKVRGSIAGWSSLVARRAHNPKVVGSNPAPATNLMAARCSVVIASEAPFGAFLWPKEKRPGGHRHVGQGSAIDAAFATDS